MKIISSFSVSILKKAKNLRDVEDEKFRRVFIGPDLSITEREQERKLRSELKERYDRGEKNWVINKGRIVERRNFRQ